MDFLKKNKISVGVILVGVLGFYLYSISGGGGSTAALVETQPAVGAELLATLESVPGIRLDSRIFENPSFKSLNDFGVKIPPQESGRRNPFAPVGK